MSLKEILNQPEGRRLEFKVELPEHSSLAKTVVAFANDAGGELYIGVADDPLRSTLFHYAKVECARFKGVSTKDFIDQKSITTNIAAQAEEAYNFVLRHINKGATVEGVYTVSRWEYPVKAIREDS